MTKSLAHVSEKPWSEITKADHTPEQWHAACLIHQHQGTPTSKDQCKLPVRTPGGAVNRNGVHAAAAALAGARGGVNASDAEMTSAKKSLIRLYGELGEDPPSSLTHSMDDAFAHYGVKGMKWGVHNGEVGKNASRSERKAAKKASKLAYKAWKKEVGGEKVANEVFQDATKSFGPAVKIINNDPAFRGKDLTTNPRLARQYDNAVAEVFNQHLATASIERTVTNTGRAMIYQFDRSVGMMRAQESQLVLHADQDQEDYPDFIAEMDELGHVLSLRRAKSDDYLAQMDVDDILEDCEDIVDEYLEHYGVKGMKWGVRTKRSAREGPSEDSTRVGQIHGRVKSQKSTRPLSNKELQEAITRMNLEQQYSRLSGGLDKTRRQKVASWVHDLIVDTGQQTAKNVVNSQVKDALDKKMEQGRYDPISVAERQKEAANLGVS